MKFTITISGTTSKAISTMRGFASLTDAAVSACAIAEARLGEDLFVSISAKVPGGGARFGRCLSGVSCESDRTRNPKILAERCQAELNRLREERRLAKIRWKWIQEHGGYDGEVFTAIRQDLKASALFYAHEFASLAEWISQSGAGGVEQKVTERTGRNK